MGAVLRPFVRGLMSRISDPAPLRWHLNLSARWFFRPVPGARYRASRYAAGALMPALWVTAGEHSPDRVLLYLHGGGYLAGSPRTHRKLVARLCREARIEAFVPAYRLAPEDPAPAAFEDAIAAHAHLLERGYRPRDIILGGDSAGGGLALALLSYLCGRGLQPAAVFAWSPCCDLTFSGASVQENARRDYFFPGHRVHDLAAMILGGTPADDPRVSPLFAAFPDCPPVLLQVSACEILRDDAHRMAARLEEAGAEARLETWEGAVHVWQMFDGWIPEARAAIRNTAQFMRGPGG